ncbi:MAG: RsmD family RNA methyltransferase, partial [Micrococcales bacterium]
MTRIIAGIAGSRQLVGPAAPTRPTSDRIRESIFNRLDNWDALDGASVLDLYAGTGALALEAVSRGAKL